MWTPSYQDDVQGDGPWREFGTGETGSTSEVDGVGRVGAGVFGDSFRLDAVAAQPFIAGVADGARTPQAAEGDSTEGFSTFAATFIDDPETSRRYNDTDPVTDRDEFTPTWSASSHRWSARPAPTPTGPTYPRPGPSPPAGPRRSPPAGPGDTRRPAAGAHRRRLTGAAPAPPAP